MTESAHCTTADSGFRSSWEVISMKLLQSAIDTAEIGSWWQTSLVAVSLREPLLFFGVAHFLPI